MNLKRLMKPYTITDINKLKFPVYVSLKLDGIRCVIKDGQALSFSMKPIRNKFVQEQLKGLPDGLDGELILKDLKTEFREVSSAIMSEDGEPDFYFYVFDKFIENEPFYNRYFKLQCTVDNLENERVKVLNQLLITNVNDLNNQIEYVKNEGYEGLIVRSELGLYKQNRSTEKEGILGRIKFFEDSEAKIIGFEEQYENTNAKVLDERGLSKRSQNNDGMVAKNTLGSLILSDIHDTFKLEFNLGTGFNDKLRQDIWNNKDKYKNLLVKYKYQPCGSFEKPRLPVFLGFRDKDDLEIKK